MLDDAILMGVPEALRSDFAAGTVYRVGALLFRHGQAGIVSHVQETAVAQQAASMMLKGAAPHVGSVLGMATGGPPAMIVGAVTKVAQVGMQGIAIAQNEQIKAAVATLQSLQLASLAVSAVGIGVSVAGFAILSQKIGHVSDQVAALDARLDRMARSIDELRHEYVREDFDRLRTACEQMDEAWYLGDPEPQWRSVAQELHGIQNRFSRRIRRIVSETEEIGTVEPFIEAFALAGANRTACRLAAGDAGAAYLASESFAREFEEITAPIGAASLLTARLREEGISPGDSRYAVHAERVRSDVEVTAASLRERDAVVSSTPITLRRLEQSGISGRHWLERARHETSEPLMFLAGETG
ncbi:hypothetical protein F1C10_15690 (plasmid) [Sphingomonas sp. NBWT7]|uniref:hypothetical protein n=1 Tax=Sphingomonas sp. NBWT7 TaxID=2596913 RepID=UPI001628DBAF|nr:hypothetical protein [Sphingomonas sp. NBWT7]QNE33570.1 hypothetical protein F1C10_15690 [Sphingomonas sp. NBWT7]